MMIISIKNIPDANLAEIMLVSTASIAMTATTFEEVLAVGTIIQTLVVIVSFGVVIVPSNLIHFMITVHIFTTVATRSIIATIRVLGDIIGRTIIAICGRAVILKNHRAKVGYQKIL